MSGLMSRGLVLTMSRVSNFAILVLSPLLLVRILDVDGYGRYQEFMIYATLFITVCGFGIDASLTYFLPKYPDQERQFLSQNSALVLISSSICLLALFLAQQPFRKLVSFDFILPLAAYVFCFVNLNWPEYYWIAKRRTDLVFYYSAVRLAVRVGVLVIVAYLTRDVIKIIWSLVAVEALRLSLVAAYLLHGKLLTTKLDPARTREQARFAGPVGLASLMQQSSRSIGKLFISGALGPGALAYYAVASYLLPMVRVVRSSIAEVVFPELVRARHNPSSALRLWQRTNVIFCLILFPLFVLLSWYGDLFITTLFTDKYLPAVPVFQVYIFWLLRRCFNADSLLRTKGKTGFMLVGAGMAVAINVPMMVLFYWWLGLIGPAVAYVLAETLLEVYYLTLVKREFALSFASLIDWGGVWRVGAAALAGLPVLMIADQLPGPELLRAAVASVIFVAACWFVAYRLGVADIRRIVQFGTSWARKSKRAR